MRLQPPERLFDGPINNAKRMIGNAHDMHRTK
jgi:hypothetical protein